MLAKSFPTGYNSLLARTSKQVAASYALLDPSRAAHASLEGYLYQAWLGVERWLDLGPDEALRCEGDEDLDRLLIDGAGGVSEQVKSLTGGVNVRDEVVKGTLRRFTRPR
jgi:hypothetical protein